MNKNELLTAVTELSKVSIEKSKLVLESLIIIINKIPRSKQRGIELERL